MKETELIKNEYEKMQVIFSHLIPVKWTEIVARYDFDDEGCGEWFLYRDENGELKDYLLMTKGFDDPLYIAMNEAEKKYGDHGSAVLKIRKEFRKQNVELKVLYYTLDNKGNYKVRLLDQYDYAGERKHRMALWRYDLFGYDSLKETDKEIVLRYFSEEDIKQGIRNLAERTGL